MIDGLNLELAWKRLKYDRPDRIFVNHPHQIDIIDANLDSWLNKVRQQLTSGYIPSVGSICYVPKANWLVRPACVLTLEDEVVYNSLIGSEYARIYESLKWKDGNPDIAYRISPNVNRYDWIRRDFKIWSEWRLKSQAAIKKGATYVLTTDIAGFYENIDFWRLRSDLANIAVNTKCADLILVMLNKWAIPCKKGIPQGYSASDILAKLYLDSIDRGMRDAGFCHLRYVDDYRVFCNSKNEAKLALLKLNSLLRSKGLHLQSAKTRILTVDEATAEINGVDDRIHLISKQLALELAELGGGCNSGTLADIDRVIGTHADDVKLEALERAFDEGLSSEKYQIR